jgi:hypothetical protein
MLLGYIRDIAPYYVVSKTPTFFDIYQITESLFLFYLTLCTSCAVFHTIVLALFFDDLFLNLNLIRYFSL